MCCFLVLFIFLNVSNVNMGGQRFIAARHIITFYFYRAMICIARTIRRRKMSVCPSVRPPHAGVLSKRLYIASNFFTIRYSYTILLLPFQTVRLYSNGEPLTGASNAKGYEKNRDFRPLSRFIHNFIHREQ